MNAEGIISSQKPDRFRPCNEKQSRQTKKKKNDRALGVHISKVLSVQLDVWTEDQVEFMAGMGNQLANEFLEYHVPYTWLKPSHLEPRDYREAYIKVRYL